VLLIRKKFLEAMISHALGEYPLEACGLLAGTASGGGTDEVHSVHPADNLAASARIYEVDPKAMLRADREAEAAGGHLIGVYHSHTHTDAKPSPTDVAQAPDPDWHYVLVSLRDVHPSVRSWTIRDGKMEEEAVVVE
jgi:[CysO sulfur-carrier protein]-S-L-cysteine hydrolase